MELLKLNLGAGDRPEPGYLSVDIDPTHADRVADLSVYPWPFESSSVAAVKAQDVFEHLPDKRATMNELWRILGPGGRAEIVVPTTRGAGAFCDPTHVSYWTAGDFEYYEAGNFARERFRGNAYYGIKADFRIVSLDQDKYLNRFQEEVWKVTVVLEAVK